MSTHYFTFFHLVALHIGRILDICYLMLFMNMLIVVVEQCNRGVLVSALAFPSEDGDLSPVRV